MGAGALVISAIGLGVQAYGAYKQNQAMGDANDEQRKLDEANKQNYLKEVDESVRRTERDNRQTQGTAAAQVGASGFGAGSSMDAYLNTLQSQQADDVDWMRTSGASQSSIMDRESAARSRNARAQQNIALIQNVGSFAGSAVNFSTKADKYKW